MSKETKINFIPDKAINLQDNDQMGTRPYFEALKEIIVNSADVHTVGLLGGWGSGKSSIIETLKKHFNGDSNAIKVVTYDAWKYSNSSFERTFIFEIADQLGMDAKSLSKDFYQSENKETDAKLSPVSVSPRLVITFFLFGFFASILFLLIPELFGVSSEAKSLKDFLIKPIAPASLLAILGTVLQNAVEPLKTSTEKPYLFSTEQFKDRFEEIVAKATNKGCIQKLYKSEEKKIVIVVDNIDRCNQDLAKRLLQTIKTFLESDNVLFIVPVDEDALKEHLELSSDENKSEFLRKLFNTTLRIKSYSFGELYEFCESLNKEYSLNFSSEILQMSAAEFSRNPRRIIQFFNILQSEMLLAIKQEESGTIRYGAITNNLSLLAKILIIREEWPVLYKEINRGKYLLELIHKEIRRGNFDYSSDRNKWILTTQKVGSVHNKEIILDNTAYLFLKRTLTITESPEGLDPFFLVRDVNSELPDTLIYSIETGDWEAIKNELASESVSHEKLISYLLQKFNSDLLERNLWSINGLSLLNLLGSIFNEIGAEKFDGLSKNGDLTHVFSVLGHEEEISKLLPNLPVQNLIPLQRWLESQGKVSFFNSFIKTMELFRNHDDTEPIKDLIIGLFLEYKDENKKLKRLFKLLPHFIIKNSSLALELLPKLETSEQLSIVINQTVIKHHSVNFPPESNQELQIQLSILKRAVKYRIVPDTAVSNYTKKIIEKLRENNIDKTVTWLNSLSFVEYLEDQSILRELFPVLEEKYSWLISICRSGELEKDNMNAYFAFIDLVSALYLNDEYIEKDKNLIQFLIDFYQATDDVNLKNKVLEKMNIFLDKWGLYNWEFKDFILYELVKENECTLGHSLLKIVQKMLKATKLEKGLSGEDIYKIMSHFIIKIKLKDAKTGRKSIFLSKIKEILKSLPQEGVIFATFESNIKKLSPSSKALIFKDIIEFKNDSINLDIINSIFNYPDGRTLSGVIRLIRDEYSEDKQATLFNSIVEQIGNGQIAGKKNHQTIIKSLLSEKVPYSRASHKIVLNKLEDYLISRFPKDTIYAIQLIRSMGTELSKSEKKTLKALIGKINQVKFSESVKNEILNFKKWL